MRQRVRFTKVEISPGKYDKARVVCVLNRTCARVSDNMNRGG